MKKLKIPVLIITFCLLIAACSNSDGGRLAANSPEPLSPHSLLNNGENLLIDSIFHFSIRIIDGWIFMDVDAVNELWADMAEILGAPVWDPTPATIDIQGASRDGNVTAMLYEYQAIILYHSFGGSFSEVATRMQTRQMAVNWLRDMSVVH